MIKNLATEDTEDTENDQHIIERHAFSVFSVA